MSHISLRSLAHVRSELRDPGTALSRRVVKTGGLHQLAGLFSAIESAAAQFERSGSPTAVTRLEFSAGHERWSLKAAANGEWTLELKGQARRGAPTRASDADVRTEVFRVTMALECASSVMRSEEGSWSVADQPDAVLRGLSAHPIARWYRGILADLTAHDHDGQLCLAVRTAKGTRAVECSWEAFLTGALAPVDVAERIVAAVHDLSPSRVHDKRFPREKRAKRTPIEARRSRKSA